MRTFQCLTATRGPRTWRRTLSTRAQTELFTWGESAQGQTGHPKLRHQPTPKSLLIDPSDPIVSIACGEAHSLAVSQSGAVYGFGASLSGQLCSEDEIISHPTKLPVSEPIVQAAAGKFHTILLSRSGEVFSFGSGESWQLGYHAAIQRQPKKIEALKGVNVRRIICGGYHNFAFDEQHNIYAWGQGHFGQTGTGIVDNTHTPQKIDLFNGSDKIVDISAGIFHSLALTEQGAVYAWGGGKEGQLGLPSKQYLSVKPVPVQIRLDETDRIVKIASGVSHNIAVSETGRLFCWGSNSQGQLGTGDFKMCLQPQEITSAFKSPPQKVSHLVCGPFHALAKMADGSVFVWGQGTDFQLGTGYRQAIATPKMLPADEPLSQNDWIGSAAGWGHTMILAVAHPK